MVWMPLEGTIHNASSERSRILPKRPRNRAQGVSATVTPRFMKACLVVLNAYLMSLTLFITFLAIKRRPLSMLIAFKSQFPFLVKTLAAPLNENQQHHDKTYGGDDSYQSIVIHLTSFLLNLRKELI